MSRKVSGSIQSITTLEDIENGMRRAFQDAQNNLNSHRKLVTVLRTIQIRARELHHEDAFNLFYVKLLNHVLALKRGEKLADRIVKFCSAFVLDIVKEDDDEGDFIDYVIRHLLRGIGASNKNVRYRVVQILAYLVNYITEIDPDLFQALFLSLKKRLVDKESVVRIQAVVAISRFQHIDLAEIIGDIDDTDSASQLLLYAMQNDESPEVRRAAMLNLKKDVHTLQPLLQRARDVHYINRRLVYSRIMKEFQDFRQIDFDLRDQLLNWGLHDRDTSVKNAAVHMLSKTWMETVQDDIMELIENLYVVDSKTADAAMMYFFKARPETLTAVQISENDWKELTTDKIFLYSVFYQYCKQNNMYELIDNNFPELTELSKILEKFLKVRDSMVGPKKDLIQQYNSSLRKVERLDQKLYANEVQCAQLRAKIDEETAHIERFNEKLKAKRPHDDSFSDDSDAESELKAYSESVASYKIDVKKKQTKLSKIEKVAHSQIKEREKLVAAVEEIEAEYGPFAARLRDLDFIIVRLIMMAKEYDFNDYVGYRRLLPIIRLCLTSAELPDRLTEVMVQLLRKTSSSEKDFSALCVEIITDVRDSMADEQDETFVSAVEMLRGNSDDGVDDDDDDETPHKRQKVGLKIPDELLLHCLMILQHYWALLERNIDGDLANQSLLESIVFRALSNHNKPIRMLAYKCLGLHAMLDAEAAANNLVTFGAIASNSNEEDLKMLATKVIFDVLLSHGCDQILRLDRNPDAVDSLSLSRLFYKLLTSYEAPAVVALTAEGLCKLFLADVLVDFGEGSLSQEDSETDQEIQLLEALVISYFHPKNVHNHELKQILTFCMPAYTFSHPQHQAKLVQVSGDCLYRIFRSDIQNELLPTPLLVVNQLIHWGDPQQVIGQSDDDVNKSMAHFWLATSFLQVIEQDSSKAVKKSIIANLHRLKITEHVGVTALRGLDTAIDDTKAVIQENKSAEFKFDAPTERSLEKFHVLVRELLEKAERLAEQAPQEATPAPATEADEEMPAEKEEEMPAPAEDKERAEKGKEAGEDEVSSGPTPQQQEELRRIDEMLAEEDDVEYDI